MRLILLVFLISSLAGASESALEKIRNKYHIPVLGASSLHEKGNQIWVVGKRKTGDPTAATEKDRFHLGSCTKAMTATLLALLVERGKLRWDSTLEELFPQLDLAPTYKKVTIGEVTAHRSGMTGDLIHFGGGRLWRELEKENLDPVVGRKFAVKELLSAPPAFAPRSRFEYSNGNYIVAGVVVENLTGKNWERVMRDELFDPLEMKSCGFGSPANPKISPPDEPWPHVRNSENGMPVAIPPTFRADNPRSVGPAGTAHCSLADWGKFVRLHLDGFNGKNTAILKAESFSKLHESYPRQTYTYGGWNRLDRDWANGPALTHAGSNSLNYANVWIAPKIKRAYLTVTNIGDESAVRASDEATGILITDDLPFLKDEKDRADNK